MTEARKADTAGILGETFELLGDNARAALLFIAVVGGLSAVGALLGLVDEGGNLTGFDFGFMIDETDTLASALFKVLSAIVGVIASYLFARELLAERGRLGAGGTRIWAYIGMSIVSAIGIVLGLILLIVPGVIVMVRWSAATGYLIGERSGVIESLSESWDATRGHGWSIFLAGLVLFVGFLVVAGIGGALAATVGGETLIAVLSALAEGVGSAVSLTFGIAIYLLVSDGTGEIEEVFA